MRRAVGTLGFALLVSLALTPPPAWAQKPPGLMNAIGLLDFGHKPDFKVGSWVKYHLTSKSQTGVADDYTVTVVIAGEERWWGEDCFWVETTTQSAGGPTAIASLMSYDVFRDSLALQHMQYYVRKVVNEVDEDGHPIMQVYKRAQSTLRSREPASPTFGLQIDTVGTETIRLDRGEFACTKVQMMQGRSQTGSGADSHSHDGTTSKAFADSTDYIELRETRTTFMTQKVPITHIAREDIEQKLTRKAWKIGQSSEATPTVVLDDTRGSAVLVDYGENGKASLLPPSMARTLSDFDAAGRLITPKAATRPRAAARKRG